MRIISFQANFMSLNIILCYLNQYQLCYLNQYYKKIINIIIAHPIKTTLIYLLLYIFIARFDNPCIKIKKLNPNKMTDLQIKFVKFKLENLAQYQKYTKIYDKNITQRWGIAYLLSINFSPPPLRRRHRPLPAHTRRGLRVQAIWPFPRSIVDDVRRPLRRQKNKNQEIIILNYEDAAQTTIME